MLVCREGGGRDFEHYVERLIDTATAARRLQVSRRTVVWLVKLG
jgi:hypothetical protein